MPRIDNRIIYSVFYLYHSEEEAETGNLDGGTGFLLHMQSQEYPDKCDIYAVTCGHVIEAGATVIRMASLPFAPLPLGIIPFAKNQWIISETDDLAIAYLGRKNLRTYGHYSFPYHLLITKEVMTAFDIFLGEDVYMVGRFKYHDGKHQNRPSVRSGIISMMADEFDPVQMDEDDPELTQEAFIVELHAISGFSGSPVIWKLPLADIVWEKAVPERRMTEKSGETPIGPWLLGIEVAVWKDKGVSVVIPGWIIKDMIESEVFDMTRKEEDKKTAKQKENSPLELTYKSNKKPVDLTEETFTEALRRVSRKTSAPAEETKETSE